MYNINTYVVHGVVLTPLPPYGAYGALFLSLPAVLELVQFFQPYIFKSVSCLIYSSFPPDVPGEVIEFVASVGFLSVTFNWTPPSFLGVPPTLVPADFIYYILDVMNDTDSVGGATVPHPTTTVMVNLTYPCEEYTAIIFARNRQAGNGSPTMTTFTLNETSVWQPNEMFLMYICIV